MVATLLLRDHDVLVALTPQDPRVLRFEPPLIVRREELDRLIEALDEVLSRGLARIAADWARHRRARGLVAR
jgi:ornithine--oxo-acid transaminase